MRKVMIVIVLVLVLSVALVAAQQVRADSFTRPKPPPQDCFFYAADAGVFVWGPCPTRIER